MRNTLLVVCLMLVAITGQTKNVYEDSLLFQVVQYQFVLDRDSVKKVTLIKQKDGGYAGIQVELKPELVAEFDKMSTQNKGKKMNIVMNNRIISSSIIQTALGANFLLSGIPESEAVKFIEALHLDN